VRLIDNLEPEFVLHPDWQQGIALATITNFGLTVEMIPFHRNFGKAVAQWRDREYIEE
jgi:hypothetical protein